MGTEEQNAHIKWEGQREISLYLVNVVFQQARHCLDTAKARRKVVLLGALKAVIQLQLRAETAALPLGSQGSHCLLLNIVVL